MSDACSIVQFKGDVEFLKARHGATDRWLAVTPLSMDDLDRAQQTYKTESDLSTDAELNAIGEAGFKRAEALVQAGDAFLQKHGSVFNGVAPLRLNFVHIKYLLDALTVRLDMLLKIIDQGATTFRITKPPSLPWSFTPSLFYNGNESIYADLLDVLQSVGKARVEVVSRSPVAAPGPNVFPWHALGKRLSSIPHRIGLFLSGLKSKNVTTKKILLLSTHYDLSRVASDFLARGVVVFVLELENLTLRRFESPVDLMAAPRAPTLTKAPLDVFQKSSVLKEYAQHRGVDYSPVVARILDRYLDWAAIELKRTADFIDSCHARYKFDLVMSPFGPIEAKRRIVFEFFKKKNIPIAIMQHGGYGYSYNPITNYYEFGFDHHFLSWGQGVGEHYTPTKKGDSTFVPLGSPSLDTLFANRSKSVEKPKQVMYVINGMRGYSAYFPGGQVLLDTAYYRLQKDIITALAKYSDKYEIVLKATPSIFSHQYAYNPIYDWIKEQNLKVRLERAPFMDVIHEPGLIIIDFPSTTLVQAVTTNADVAVMTGWEQFKMNAPAMPLLQRRAVCCNTSEDLIDAAVSWLRGDRSLFQGKKDDSFLKQYGTHLNDGNSLGRTEDYLAGLIRS